MGVSWALIITPVGAVIAALVGVLVGQRVTTRARRQEISQQEQLEACDQFYVASSKIMVGLAALCEHHLGLVAEAKAPAIDWSAWQSAVALVNHRADKKIVTCAHAVDEQFWRAHCEIQACLTSWEEWFVLRQKIDLRRLEFVNAVRHVAALEPLASLSGRPPADDPIWNPRRGNAAETTGP